MKIKQSSDIAFIANDKMLQAAFAKVTGITLYVDCLENERKHILACVGKSLYVIGITPDAFACVRLDDVEVEHEGSVSFDIKTVQGLLKNAGSVRVTVDEGRLAIKAIKGRYKANTEFQEVEDVDIMMVADNMETDKIKPLKADVIKSLRDGFKHCSLTNFYSDEVILAYVDITKSGVSIATADNFHVAWFTEELKTGLNTRFTMPSKTFHVIDKFMEDTDAAFDLGSGKLRVVGDSFVLSLPEVQSDVESFELVPSYVNGLSKPTTSIVYDRKDMQSLDNMFTIMDEDTKMELKIKDDKSRISLSTRSGSVSDAFTIKKKGKDCVAHIDPRIFNDLFKATVSSTIPMTFHAGGKGASSCFQFKTRPTKTSQLIQIGTYYDE